MNPSASSTATPVDSTPGSAPDHAPTASVPDSPTRWYILMLMVFAYAIMHMDRQIVTLLLEPIKLEFGLSDSQLGFLAGLSFAIAFSAAGIPLGLMVDRVNRVRLLASLTAIWSGLTALCGFASSYLVLVIARIGIGAAESGGSPTSSSLIADYFRRKERPLAFGIYHTGTQIGSIIGFAAAAIVAQAYGWRAAFFLAGVPGLFLTVLLLTTMREPRRGATDDEQSDTTRLTDMPVIAAKAPTFGETLRFIASQRAQVHTFIGFVLAMTVTSGLSAWLAPMMMRGYGVSLKTAGLTMAFGISSCGVLGALTGGALATRLGVRNPTNLARLIAAAMLLTVPAAITGILSQTFAVTVGGFAVQTFANSMITATSFVLALELTQTRMRGTTMALLLVLSNVFGYGLGPQIVGWLSDAWHLAYGLRALPYAMVALALGNLWAMTHMLLASRSMKTSLARARAASGLPSD